MTALLSTFYLIIAVRAHNNTGLYKVYAYVTSNFHAAGTPQADSLYNSPSLNITFYQETYPPSRVVRQLGLWDAGNNFIAAARAVTDLPAAYRYNFSQMAQGNYVIDNAAMLNEAYLDALDLKARAAETHALLMCWLPCVCRLSRSCVLTKLW